MCSVFPLDQLLDENLCDGKIVKKMQNFKWSSELNAKIEVNPTMAKVNTQIRRWPQVDFSI